MLTQVEEVPVDRLCHFDTAKLLGRAYVFVETRCRMHRGPELSLLIPALQVFFFMFFQRTKSYMLSTTMNALIANKGTFPKMVGTSCRTSFGN